MSKVEYKDGTRCRMANKKMYSMKQAQYLAERLKPDERGAWGAYKCKYGKRHYHIGHEKLNTSISKD